MEWWKTVIEFKPLDLAFLVSGLGAIIWFFTNRHYSKKDQLRMIRLDTYRAFLNKMDEAFYSSRINFGEIMKVSAEVLTAILKNPDDSDSALIEMNNKLTKLTNDSIIGWSIFSNEINQLTLVCSKEMLVLIDELRELNKNLLDSYQVSLASINFLDPTAEEKIKNASGVVDGERMKFLNDQIKILMRREVGNG